MKVLVAGGTGFIGSAIIDKLLERLKEASIGCMTRNPSAASSLGGRLFLVEGDLRNEESIDKATRGVDVVVQSIQFPNHPVENPRRGFTYMQIDAKGTRRMAMRAAANGVKRFIYVSGAGADRKSDKSWFRAKAIGEEAVRDSGMEFVILRPSWVYGPEDKSLNRLITLTRTLPFVPVIGDGKSRIQPIHVQDVAEVAARAVTLEEATDRVFGLGGPEALTMDEVLRAVQRVLGVKRPLIHQPKGLVKIATWPLQFLPNPPMTPQAVEFLTGEALVDPKPAEETFSMRFLSLEEGLRRYLVPRTD